MISQLERTDLDVALVGGWSPVQRRDVAIRILDGAPLFDIEVSSACNDECPFCPRGTLIRSRQNMLPETFQTVESFLPENAVVMFSGLGEPLLNPHLPDFVARLKSREISSCVITNGLLLTPERATVLMEAGLDQFQVSVRELAPSLPRSTLLESNLRHLADVRHPGLRRQLNVVLDDDSPTHLAAVRSLADKLGFDLFVRRCHSRGGEAGGRQAGRPDDGCGIFAAVTMITAQGAILACTNDIRGTSEMGHVSSCRWLDVLTWKAAVISSGEWFPPCIGCDDDYRWVVLANSGVDLRKAAPLDCVVEQGQAEPDSS